MSLKRFIASVAAFSIFASVGVLGFEHWSLEFAVDYIKISDAEVLDAPIAIAEFYDILGECVGEELSVDTEGGITRESACVAIAQYLDGSPENYFFTDSDEISAKSELRKLYGLGLIDGYPDGSFRPRALLTYGEAFKLFSKLEALLDVPEETPSATPPTTSMASSPGSATAQANTPSVSFTAAMGSSFRSIDLNITAAGDNPQVSYAVLESGSPKPSAAEIISMSGDTIHGRWSGAGERAITLSVVGEHGLIDGYNYDIYMVAVDEHGRTSEVASVSSVMAMPFSALNTETGTFTIQSLSVDEINRFYPDIAANSKRNPKWIHQTARQLENIQRLADLYASTGGVHGSEEFLRGGYTYVLAGDMDLSYYMAQERESGWKPIGAGIPFTGYFEGNGHTITGLYIDRDEGVFENGIPYAGLFGRTRSAAVRNLVLESPVVMARGLNRSEGYACVGTLAGESANSIIEQVRVESPRVIGSAAGDSLCAAGGVIGSAINSDLSGITVTNAEIVNNGMADVSGGVAGRYYLSRSGKYLLNDLFVSGSLNAAGKAGGGVVGTIDALAGGYLVANNIDSLIRVTGGADFAGGIAGNVGYEALLSPDIRITFDNCYASGSIKAAEVAGGLFGKINSSDRNGFVVKNSASEADLLQGSSATVLGGFAGEVHSASFENCHSVGSSITTRGSDAGGFVGVSRGHTDFIACLTNRNIQAAENAGGFVGSQDGGTVRFYGCSSSGRVSGDNVVGDFAGFIATDKFAVEIVDCTIKAPDNSGRLVGDWR